MIDNSLPYWMALAHARGITNTRKMQFLIDCIHDKMTLQDALDQLNENNRLGFHFDDKEWNGILNSIKELPNYAFLAEQISDQGIHTINVMDTHVYPKILKQNLGKESPLLIYGKGNMDLLKMKSVAIVGSRNSSAQALAFTENVSKSSVRKNMVVVSGFAKGVDRHALDSTLKYNGQSIIVLPQGIETYKSKTYYQDIVKGNVLVISIYHPKVPWSVGLAMDRNKIIYGLAEKIYAAESNSSGGTWEGVLDGLKRGRKIMVRLPVQEENNANLLLIRRGAVAVDMYGYIVSKESTDRVMDITESYQAKQPPLTSNEEIINKVIEILKQNDGKGITTFEIMDKLSLENSMSKKLSIILTKSDLLIKQKKGRQNFYLLKEMIPTQGDLFKLK